MSCLNFSIRCNLRSNQTVLWHPSDRTYWRTAGQKRSLPHVVCSHTWWLTATKAIHLCLRHSGQSQSSTKPTEILVQVDFLARPCLHESTIKKGAQHYRKNRQSQSEWCRHMWVLGQIISHPIQSVVSCEASLGLFYIVLTVSHQKLPSLLACFLPLFCKAETPLVNRLNSAAVCFHEKISGVCFSNPVCST